MKQAKGNFLHLSFVVFYFLHLPAYICPCCTRVSRFVNAKGLIERRRRVYIYMFPFVSKLFAFHLTRGCPKASRRGFWKFWKRIWSSAVCTSSFVLGTCRLVCTGNNLLEFKPGNSALASGLYPRCQLVTGITNGFLLINKVSFINDEEERNRWEDCKLLGFSKRRQRLTRCNYSHRDLIKVRSKSIVALELIHSLLRLNNNEQHWIDNEISYVNWNFRFNASMTSVEYQKVPTSDRGVKLNVAILFWIYPAKEYRH